jgi:hypothetical protein
MILDTKNTHVKFTNWQRWTECFNISQIEQPGVYAIALSDIDLGGSTFSICPEIRYFGMTVSKGGLASRLSQFHGALFENDGPHGGAWRFRFDYPNAIIAVDKFFVSVACFDCNPARKAASDLREMGRIVGFEYLCFADYLDLYGHLPKYNDTKLRPKKYFGIGPNLSFSSDLATTIS